MSEFLDARDQEYWSPEPEPLWPLRRTLLLVIAVNIVAWAAIGYAIISAI